MRKGILVAFLIILAASLGIALAAGVGALARRGTGWLSSPGRGWGMGPGMMDGWRRPVKPSAGQRLTIDQAKEAAVGYLQGYPSGLKIAEVMEFEENYYAIAVEEATGKGAFEILIDPFSGDVFPEPGPNMMWNLKYGHMGSGRGDSDLSLEQASELAQAYLDANLPGATIEGTGTAFYGYATFDYEVNGSIAGMLSINGFSGEAWMHTWHGRFISEKEYEE